MLSDRDDDGRPALGRFHSSCPERAPSQLTVGEISPTGTAQTLPPTGRTLNIGEQECHDPRRPAPRGHSHTTVEVGSGPDTLSEYRIRAPSSLHCTHSETYVAWALCHNVQLDTGWTSHLRIGHGNHLKFIVDSHVRLHLLVRRSG